MQETKAHVATTKRVLASDPIKRAAERDPELGEAIMRGLTDSGYE